MMAFLHILTTLFCTAIVLTLFVGESSAGECCVGYTDILGTHHSGQWCEVYCCGVPKIGGLSCCSTLALRAAEGDRSSFCGEWFTYKPNIWAPIVIGVVAVLIIIVVCVCCVKCLCN